MSSRSTIVAILLLSGSAAHADRTLTLADALELGRAANRDLKAARARLEQSETGIAQARVALMPQLTAQGKYTHNYKEVDVAFSQFTAGIFGLADVIKATSGNPVQNAAINQFEQVAAAQQAGQPSTIIIQKQEQLDGVLNLTVPVIVPQAYEALRSAKLTHASNQANFAVTEAQLLYSVAQAYYAAAGADELVGARKHGIDVAKETFDNAKARFAAGVVNRVEVTRAEVALVHAEQSETESEDTQAQAYRSLATLIDLHEPFRVTPEERPAAPAESVDAVVVRALTLRPELPALRKSIDASAATANSSAWRWAPSLSAFGNVRAFNYRGFSGDLYSWAVGAQLDWTLYDGGARDAARALALAQKRESQAKLDLLRDTVTDEVVNARRAQTTKQRALATARRSFELSTETLRLVRAQYDAGTARQLDLLQAQDSLVTSEVEVAQARFDLALAQLLLERTSGTFPPNHGR